MKHRIPQLDAVRGIAILIVIFHNSVYKFPSLPLQSLFSYGWMGVDLFFVLSGFLITAILLDTSQSKAFFKNFYARRCLRIWPLYYAVFLFMFVVVPLLRPSMGFIIVAHSSPWWAYPLFLQNFLVHPSTGATGPLGVTWSVAIEEQFYVVWALVVRYCSRRQLQRIAVTVICFSPLLRLYLAAHHVDLYSNVFCRLDGLMAGALLALVVHSERVVRTSLLTTAWVSLFAAVVLALLSEAFQTRWLTFSLSATASAAFVYLALFSTAKWFRSVLTSRWLLYTGTISYGLYLLHRIPFDLAIAFHFDRHPALALLIGVAASYILAILSWNLVEKPLLRLKRFFEFRAAQPLDANREFVTVLQ
jgi:peptidoglycan/LPS O-acetylase OafA/YrhL